MIRTKPSAQSVTITRDQIADRVKARARDKVRRELVVMGEDFERQARAIVQNEFERREGDRHKANTVHLEDSFTYRIVEGPDNGFPMRLDLTIKPGVSAKKIAAIEYGAQRDYVIEPSGAVAGWGGRSISRSRASNLINKFPGVNVRNTAWLRWEDDGGEEHFARSVIHKAFPGAFIMRRARDAMLARRRR